MNPTLPQHEPYPLHRQNRLDQARETFKYTYDYLKGIPMAVDVPLGDKPGPEWAMDVANRIANIMVNAAIVNGDEARSDPDHAEHQALEQDIASRGGAGLREALEMIVKKALTGKGIPAKSIADFRGLFQSIEVPAAWSSWNDDAFFARMRLAGPNPVMLKAVSGLDERFPVTNAQYQSVMGERDSLSAAGEEGRLFVADYALVEGAPLGTFPHGQKYLEAPLALFAMPYKGVVLKPVAIQIHQRPSEASPKNPIFLPEHGDAWSLAKTCVTCADGNVHEAVVHLAQTHLVTEPVVMATRRQLAPNHPLFVLLCPHHEGTLDINDQAHAFLLSEGGPLDAGMACTIQGSIELARKGFDAWHFNDTMLPRALELRGMLRENTGALCYPYRDDALLVWNAIRDWVKRYVEIYYHVDADVRGDGELQAWVQEIGSPDGGRIRGIGQPESYSDAAVLPQIPTREYLIDVLTHVIFTPSAQHAAVNFPQYQLMSYTPFMPLSRYSPGPSSTKGVTEKDLLKTFPPLDMAMIQLEMTYMLGSIHYTQLGQYQPLQLHPHFRDHRVDKPLAELHRRLKDVEHEIGTRNENRPMYPFLLPSRIPQSINI